MTDKGIIVARITVIAAAAGMIAFGIARGEVDVVLAKAVNICFECIGLD